MLGDQIQLKATEVGEGEEGYCKKVQEEEKEGGKMDLGQLQPLQLDESFEERMFQQLLSTIVNNLKEG